MINTIYKEDFWVDKKKKKNNPNKSEQRARTDNSPKKQKLPISVFNLNNK